MTPEIENPKKLSIFIGILVIVIILVIALVLALKGSATMLVTIKWIIIGLIILGIVGLLIFAMFWLFSKQPSDTIYLNKMRYLQACKINSSPYPQDLYFKGFGEWDFKKIGRIIGVAQSVILKTNLDKPILNEDGKTQKWLIDGSGNKIKPLFEQEELIEDVIAFKRGFFSSPEMVRVLRNERSSLNSDKVFLNAMSFSPELFGFFYLPSRFRDKEIIDRVIADEIHRATLQHILKEEQNIVDDSIAISPRHQKEMERNRLQVVQQAVTPQTTTTTV